MMASWSSAPKEQHVPSRVLETLLCLQAAWLLMAYGVYQAWSMEGRHRGKDGRAHGVRGLSHV